MSFRSANPTEFRGDPSLQERVLAARLGLAEASAPASPLFGSDCASVPLALDQVAHSVVEAAQQKATLAPLSQTFTPGQLHVVGGPSGAGKTTLLSILALAVTPARGTVCWGEQNLNRLRPVERARWRRETLGLIFQSSRLVGTMTVAEHIRLAATVRRSSGAVAEGSTLLDALGMSDKLGRFPGQLSGGEKQRVAIAQALCARPAVVLADEPTAALDQTNAEIVASALRDYARSRGAVVICVSHDRTVVEAADTLLMLARP